MYKLSDELVPTVMGEIYYNKVFTTLEHFLNKVNLEFDCYEITARDVITLSKYIDYTKPLVLFDEKRLESFSIDEAVCTILKYLKLGYNFGDLLDWVNAVELYAELKQIELEEGNDDDDYDYIFTNKDGIQEKIEFLTIIDYVYNNEREIIDLIFDKFITQESVTQAVKEFVEEN